ncbi:MAG: carbohydrate ABC transporter permease [Chloroflexota bacterium]
MATTVSEQNRAVDAQAAADWKALQAAHHRNQLIRKALLTLVTLIVVLIFFFPIFYWIGASVRPFQDIFARPPLLTFPNVTWAWWEVVVGGADYGEVITREAGGRGGTGGGGTLGYYSIPYLGDSILVSTISTAIVIAVSVVTAYALSRLTVWGKQNWIFFVISTRFMPPVAVVFPIYIIYQRLGWLDTYHGVIIAHVVFNLPLAVLLLKSFFDDIPKDLDEAALVDGANRWTAFRRVVLPLAAPGMAAAAILTFIFSWNEFLLTVFLTDTEVRTLTVAMSTFDSSSGGTEWGFLAAAGSAGMVPVFIFILFVQRHLVRGLTLGAVKS